MHKDHQVIRPTFGRVVMVTLTVPIDTTEWTEITLEFRILSSSTRPNHVGLEPFMTLPCEQLVSLSCGVGETNCLQGIKTQAAYFDFLKDSPHASKKAS